jgi:hypothetical protein
VLKLLLDEQVSREAAAALRRWGWSSEVYCMAEWEQGSYLGLDDSACLEKAATQGLTLVTYDRRTLPPLLKAWAQEDRNHGRVIFVDDKTIPPHDTGGLVRALINLFEEAGRWDWTNRVCFSRR